jgi:nitrogen fixation NifU-like protein
VLLDGRIADFSYEISACSISRAATSVLHQIAVGLTVPDMLICIGAFVGMVRGLGEIEPDERLLGEAVAFAGVWIFPNRVWCAILPWTTVQEAVTILTEGSDAL